MRKMGLCSRARIGNFGFPTALKVKLIIGVVGTSDNFLKYDSAFGRQWPRKMNGDMAQVNGQV